MTNETLPTAIFLTTNFSWYCGDIHYRFKIIKRQGKCFLADFSLLRKCAVVVSFLTHFLYITFVASRIFEEILLKEDPSLNFFVEMGYLFFCYTAPVVLQVNTILFWDEIPYFLINYIKIFTSFYGKFLKCGKFSPKCLRFFSAIFSIGTMLIVLNLVIISGDPSKPQFLTSMLTDSGILKLFKVPLVLLQVWIWMSTWSQIWTVCFHLYLYTSYMTCALKEMNPIVKHSQTKLQLRTAPVFSRTIRSMQMLHRVFQQCHQSWLFPSHVTVVVWAGTLATYGVIKLGGLGRVKMGGIMLICVVYIWTMFKKFGQLHDYSTVVLENWMDSSRKLKWMKRFIKSVPTFRMEIGSFCRVTRITFITILWMMLENTINLLLL